MDYNAHKVARLYRMSVLRSKQLQSRLINEGPTNIAAQLSHEEGQLTTFSMVCSTREQISLPRAGC
mgnify:CR=1 FL=1